MGDYSIPAKFFLSHVFPKVSILTSKPITDNTILLGSKYSPDFVCMPFKYTLGTMIENLEDGANILIQAGGGCRYGYYNELQEQILKDLGYDFIFLNLVSAGHTDLKRILKELKKISSFSYFKLAYYGLLTKKIVAFMDEMDVLIRKRIGFEINSNSYFKTKEKMLQEVSSIKGFYSLWKWKRKYRKLFSEIPYHKTILYKVGLIGELYTLMEPQANYELEKMLSQYHISLTRYTNVTYLLFQKKRAIKKLLQKAKKYIHYKMGADASDNIGRCVSMCEEGYDGMIHIKSSFCTPEIGSMLILQKVCRDYQVPILFFSFDSNTSKVGLETRIEAFVDMLEMRKEK